MLTNVMFPLLVLMPAVKALRINSGSMDTEGTPYHDQVQKQNDLKLLLVIGDSVDRYMVDDWCDHHRANDTYGFVQEVFGQKPDARFGRWSEWGRVSEDFQNLLKSSGVAGWQAWQSRICIVSDLGVAAAFVHNFKGVDTQGPWWQEPEYKELYNMSCTETSPPADCHDTQRWLRPAVGAITEYLKVKPEVTIIHSNRWDVVRMHEIQHVPQESFANGVIQAEWKQNATKYIEAIKEIVPGSKVIWRTTAVRSEKNSAPGASKLSPGELMEEEGVRYLNQAARELCKQGGIPVEEMEVDRLNGIEMGFRDLRHPKPEFLTEFMDDLMETHMGLQEKTLSKDFAIFSHTGPYSLDPITEIGGESPTNQIVNEMKARVARSDKTEGCSMLGLFCQPNERVPIFAKTDALGKWKKYQNERNHVEDRFKKSKKDGSVKMVLEHVTHSGGSMFCNLMAKNEKTIQPHKNCLASSTEASDWDDSRLVWQLGKTGDAMNLFLKTWNTTEPFNAVANEDLMPASPSFGNDIVYVTLLRDPYVRHMSHRDHTTQKSLCDRGNGRCIPEDNYATRHYCGEPCRDVPFGHLEQKHLDMALENLAHFSFVGPLDHGPCFEVLGNKFSWKVDGNVNHGTNKEHFKRVAATKHIKDLQQLLDEGNVETYRKFLAMHVYDEQLYNLGKEICRAQIS